MLELQNKRDKVYPCLSWLMLIVLPYPITVPHILSEEELYHGRYPEDG